jgi:alanine or glycine:cation symporter, AGCS family
MNELVQATNDVLYIRILIPLLLGAGLCFTIGLRFIQFRHFLYMFKVLAGSRQSGDGQISSFQALATSLAARVGTGNLAGVAIALTMGGPGAIFWMWVVAFLGMSTSFVESTLAQVYKVRGPDGGYRGGPAYYMEHGLGQKWMGVLFSLALIVTFGLIFIAVQANTISSAFHASFALNQTLCGVILAVLTAGVIFGGIRAVARFAEIVVPVMAAFYLLLALFVVFQNLTELPAVIALIVKSALGIKQAAAGAIGFAVREALINGVRRGLFSNEAGMGSAPNAAATAEPQPPHPASQGYVQMLGVFVDTIVICTCTASIILLSGEYDPASGVTGIQLTQDALSAQVGPWGGIFVATALFLFAFTSIVANYSYAETNILFLRPSWTLVKVFRFAVLGMIMFGALADLPVVWTMADISMGFMAFLNLIAITLLIKVALAVAADFNRQLKAGERPTFVPSRILNLKGRIDPDVWR